MQPSGENATLTTGEALHELQGVGGREDGQRGREVSASIAVPATTETLPTAGLKPEAGLIRW